VAQARLQEAANGNLGVRSLVRLQGLLNPVSEPRHASASEPPVQRMVTDETEIETFLEWALENKVPDSLAAYSLEYANDLGDAIGLAKKLAKGLPPKLKESYEKVGTETGRRIGVKERAGKTAATSLGRLEKTPKASNREQRILDLKGSLTSIKEELGELEQVQETGGLGKALPPAVASLADVLIEEYPPDRSVYIMLGNSPVPLMAYFGLMRRKIPKLTMVNIPLGGLSSENKFTVSADPKKQRQAYGKVFGEQSEKIDAYLDHFLKPYLGTGRRFVLIDFASTGLSIVVMADLVRAYLERAKSDQQVGVFTFSKELPEDESFLMTSGYDTVAASPLGEAEKLFTHFTMEKNYKNRLFLTKYGSLDVTDLLAEESDPLELLAQKETPVDYLRLLLELEKAYQG